MPEYLLADDVRTDALTNCRNFLAFADWLLRYCCQSPRQPMTLAILDLNSFAQFANDCSHGDAVLRWVGLVLREVGHLTVYRIGGDEFVVVFDHASPYDHMRQIELLVARLNHEAPRFGMEAPVATVAISAYSGSEQLTPADIFCHLRTAILEARAGDQALHVVPYSGPPSYDLRPALDDILGRMVNLGELLDESRHLAHTDPVTGLPNMRAALARMPVLLAEAAATGRPLALLFIDGDNLRRYNTLGYAVGDAMLQRLSDMLQANIRPGDLVARWRVGDEFLVLLPDTTLGQGMAFGERLRSAIADGASGWEFPVTISIGVAAFPEHGLTTEQLLHYGEEAKDRAKLKGKNCVIAAGFAA